MADPHGVLTWMVDLRLPREVRDAVDVVRHWLDSWHHVLEAAVRGPFTIRVVRDGEATSAADDTAVIVVPDELVGQSTELPHFLLNQALRAVESAARRSPHEPPKRVWVDPDDAEVDTDPLVETLEGLEPSEMLVFGRVDGTVTDELAWFDELDGYVFGRVLESGVGTVVDTEGACGDAMWTIRLSDQR